MDFFLQQEPIFIDNCARSPYRLLCDFFFYEDLHHALANARFDSCIIIHLNPLLNKLLPKEGVKSRFPFQSEVSWDQQEILEILRNEDFDQITFKKENGKLVRCDIEKKFAPNISEHTLKQGLHTVDITAHIVNGRTTARTRKIEEETEGKVTAVELLFPEQFAKEENI